MDRVAFGASRGLRWGCLVLATTVAFVSLASDPADARSRRKRHHYKRHHVVKITYNPAYADIVVDAKTGKALHEANPDALRHPASLTKIMTLYLLFERLEAGRISLNTQLDVSAFAASQAPTKLGLRPGQSLAVEDAIKGLVTKSANDAAVVVAEALGGSESDFAQIMTRKARALGMSHTVYRNASGLPNDEQVTSARDQALLGIAIQNRFPRYYRYFSTPSFVYRGRPMRNHNHLLGRVDGVDGIKTGYTRASGFNLVTSVRRDGRHIVAVVLGGRSGGQRDARMRSLISTHIAEASTRPASAIRIAESPIEEPAKPRLASAVSAPLSLSPPPDATAAIHVGSRDPIKPVRVKTVTVKLASTKSISANAAAISAPKPASDVAVAEPPSSAAAAGTHEALPALQPEAHVTPLMSGAPVMGSRPGILGVLPVSVAAAEVPQQAKVLEVKKASESKPAETKTPIRHAAIRSGWAIQIGAFEDLDEAKERLNAAQSKVARVLGKADPYTERTTKGRKTYYRARFAGFDRDQAEAACKQLKRNDIVCMALKI